VYTSFFGFKEKPFNLTPDEKYLFLSPYHREALDHLLYGINERKGFIAITGGIGTGKTTVCRALLSHLDTATKTALIFNPFISEKELLETVNQEFGIDMGPRGGSKKDYIDALNHFLLETFSNGGNAVLLIDEAQNLSYKVLEQIRMLGNLETEKEKLIQIVLVGQFELKELLNTPSLKQLDERITVRYDLRPLDRKNIQSYVKHRLVVGGSSGNLGFTRGAFKEIYRYSLGNPRRINAVCDRGLLIAYAGEKYTISKRVIRRAVNDLRGNVFRDPMVTGWTRRRPILVPILVFLLVMVGGFTGWHFSKEFINSRSDAREITVVRPRYASSIPPKPIKEPATLFLDEKTSMAGLFELFHHAAEENNYDMRKVSLGLVSLTVQPEYHIMFKKPFRVSLSDSSSLTAGSPGYLLIREVNDEGAVAVDADDGNQIVTRDFIQRHWGYEVSWVYPYKPNIINLAKGMSSPGVLEIQRILNEIGYLVEPTGDFDESTLNAVVRFQRDLGLIVDGIVGPRTRALLYLMSD
jgi:general secretion pathway protein A